MLIKNKSVFTEGKAANTAAPRFIAAERISRRNKAGAGAKPANETSRKRGKAHSI